MIKRIKPISRVMKIEGEIHRLMSEVLSQRREWLDLEGGWAPYVDVYEKEDDLIVEAEVPGLSQRDLHISLHMSRIELKGAKKENPVSEKFRYLRLEREYGKFRRTIPLPCAVLTEKAKAILENGVLTIRLKKMRENKEKEILVKVQKSTEKSGGDNG
jgi:HSP20 family protein